MASPKKSSPAKNGKKKSVSRAQTAGKKKPATSAKKAAVRAPRKEAVRARRIPNITGELKTRLYTPSGIQDAPVTPPAFFQAPQGDLPAGYGDHFIYLMICAPYQIYAYWEIAQHRETDALQQLGAGWDKVRSILRIYNLSRDPRGGIFFDVELSGDADSWFLDAEPDQSYVVEIGLRHEDGRFIALARSNEVTTPRTSMSDVLDEEWMSVDFDRMYALSGGFEPGQSSAALRKLIEERLRSGLTSGSGGFSSGSLVKKKDRNFWLTLNCEVIVTGATAADAQVTLNGQPVKLRPDGTFTLRRSLPDSQLRFEVHAVSADRLEERSVTPCIARRTERPEPVIHPARSR